LTSEKPRDPVRQSVRERDKEQKALLISRYQEMVGVEGIRRARANHHSKRKPIQCGLTIHPGNDCAYSCIYCYIVDMGFKFHKPKPCELSSEELALSLLYNPNFNPGRNGTYIAIGSIVEPFQPELKSLTINYIEQLAKLGNPIQFSTKSHLTNSEAKAISLACNWISPLVTILTLDEAKARLLEPFAPSPQKRLETIANLADAGLKPFLFLRPILPGIITPDENLNLINESIRYGLQGVVLGNFRVTRRIIGALKKKGLDVSEIERRTRVIDGKQRTVSVQDLRDKIEAQLGNATMVYRRSCCASASSAGLQQCVHKIARSPLKRHT
jgi:DNA repair photolyase